MQKKSQNDSGKQGTNAANQENVEKAQPEISPNPESADNEIGQKDKAQASQPDNKTDNSTNKDKEQPKESNKDSLMSGFVWGSAKFLILLLLSLTTLVFSFVFGVTIYRSYFAIPDEIEVPAIQGKDIQQANSMLTKLGLRLKIDEGRNSTKFPNKVVISQEPKAGKTVRKDREILAVVSLGPEQIKVPDLKGKSEREARMILTNSKLELGKVSRIEKDSNRPDEILTQKPLAGTGVRRGTKVNVEINRGFGMATVAVPDWSGKSISNAQPLLDKIGLNMGRISWTRNEDKPKGRIIAQNPPAGSQVLSGSEVEFEVSAGNESSRMFVQRKLDLFLPQGSDEHNVRVMLVSGVGEQVIYKATHVVGDNVEMWVSGPTGSDIEVYINDKLFTRDKL